MGSLILMAHVLGAVIWVGGMAFALMVLRPAVHEVLEPPQRLALMAAVFRRFFLFIWHAMPIVILSGWALFFNWHGGFSTAAWNLHAMHLIGLIMGLVFLGVFFGPWRAMRLALAAENRPAAARAVESIRKLIVMNLILGLGVIAISLIGRIAA